jgi:hypothetical protein
MSQTYASPDPDSRYRTPGWVKALGIVVLALVLLMGVVMLTSRVQHGPGMHMPPASATESGATGGHTVPAHPGG